MKTRFFLIVVLLSLVLVAWTYIQYEFGVDKQARLDQLGRLPIYIYMTDSTRVEPLKKKLETVPYLESVSTESGMQAAAELVKAYQLPITESMLADYSLPNIITVKFKALAASLRARQQVADIITQSEIPMNDVDLQSNAWKMLDTEIGSLNRRWLVLTVFITLMVFLIMIFIRLSFELRGLLLQKRKLVSVVDALRFSTLTHRHTVMLLLFPMLASWWLYYLFSNTGFLQPVIPLWFFGIQLGALIGGSLVISIILHRYTHSRNLQLAVDAEDTLA